MLPLLLAVFLPDSHSNRYAGISVRSTQPIMHHDTTQGRWRTAGTPACAGMTTAAAAVGTRLLVLCCQHTRSCCTLLLLLLELLLLSEAAGQHVFDLDLKCILTC